MPKKPVPTFVKTEDFNSWNDDNGADYSETEIDGHLVGIIWVDNKIRGLWYNKASMGSVSMDFASLNPKYADDPCAYSELDVHWPYGD